MSLLALALLVVAGVARAQHLEDPDEELARRHFRQASQHYAAEEYREALVEFEAVRRYRQLPEVDFNIARCHDRLEEFPEAVTAYERYLAARPDARDADDVRARVALLKRRIADSTVEKPAEPPKQLAPEPTFRAPRRPSDDVPVTQPYEMGKPPSSALFWSGVAVAAAGLGGIIAGAVVESAASGDASDLRSSCGTQIVIGSPCADRLDHVHTLSSTGIGLYVAGGVLGALGLTLAFVDLARGRAVHLAFTPLPGGGSAMATLRF